MKLWLKKNKNKPFSRLLIIMLTCVWLAFCCVLNGVCMHINANAQSWQEGKAECVMELDSRRILYASHCDTRLPMASTIKILTAITVLEYCENIDREFAIPESAVGVEGSSVYLKKGDIYTIEELLYGLMLRSGNDCAVALALAVGGDIDSFCKKMNLVAQKAGALESHFSNPHGLPTKNNYTTAKDLSLITCYALQNPVFKRIVSTKFFSPRNWQNKNKLLRTCEGAIGVKTGFTKEAGRCLVSAVERNGTTLVCTLLSCPTTYERTNQLIDDAFSTYKKTLLLGKEEILSFQAGNKIVKGVSKRDFFYPILEEERALVEIKVFPYNPAKSKNIVGQFEIYLAKRLLFSGNLYKL